MPTTTTKTIDRGRTRRPGSPRLRSALGALALTLVCWIPSGASASAPAAAWGIIEDVTIHSWVDGKALVETLVLSGAFSVYSPKEGYQEPAWGYFHYVCPQGQQEICELEWADLEKAIGGCRGYGDWENLAGTLHAPGAALTPPDEYPIAYGVVQGYSPCQILEDFVETTPAPDVLVPGDTGVGVPPVEDPEDPNDPKDPQDPEDPKDPKDPVDEDPKDPKDPKYPNDPSGDPADPQDPNAPNDPVEEPQAQDPGLDPGEPAAPVSGEPMVDGEAAGCAASGATTLAPLALVLLLMVGFALRRRKSVR